MLLNHAGQVVLVNLKNYPYIEFCIEVVMGNLESLYRIYQGCTPQIQRSMKETLSSYGIILQELNWYHWPQYHTHLDWQKVYSYIMNYKITNW